MRYLGLIPARGGSKGVPRKNVKILGRKPLLQWTLDCALKVQGLDRLIVSTEDEEIAGLAREGGAEVPFLRPAHLANDTAKSIDVVNDVLDTLARSGDHYHAVCLLQPTTPFRSVKLLQHCLDRFADGDLDSLISVTRVPDHYHPNWAFVGGKDGRLTPAQGVGSVIPRRQELPPAFIRDGAVYIITTEVLRSGSFFGDRLGYVENTDEKQVNIDTPEDWATAERLAKEHADD